MMFQQSGIFLQIVCLFLFTNAELPNYMKVCKRNVEDMSGCIIKAVEHLREKLNEGIPELGVPPLDPLHLDNMKVTSGLNINLTDVVIKGAGKFKIKELKAEIEKNRFAVLLEVPELDLHGHHSIDMELLTIPLRGQGLFSAKFTDFTIAAKMKGRLVTTDDGVKRLKFDPFDIEVGLPGKKEMKIEGLFADNPTLKMAGDAVIAENVDVFFDELRPEVKKSISTTLTRLANQITTHFTYDELFPQ